MISPRPRRGSRAALVGVALAHALLVWLLVAALRPPVPARAPAPPAPTLWLRLLPEATPPAAAVAPLRPARTPPPVAAATATPRPLSPRADTEAPVLPVVPQAITLAPAPPLPASAASAPPLELRLQRPPAPTAAALARDDPRVHGEPAGRDERMAQALGTDLRLREQSMGDGAQRFRRGSACVVTRQARDAQLDPFNQGARPTPRLAGAC